MSGFVKHVKKNRAGMPATPDGDTIYFVTDENKIQLGSAVVGEAHKAPTATEVKTALGTSGSTATTKYLNENGSWVTPPNSDSRVTEPQYHYTPVEDLSSAINLKPGGVQKIITEIKRDSKGHIVSASTGDLTKSLVGLSDVDNTSDAAKKTAFTGSIASGNTGFVTGGAVYTALDSKISTSAIGANNGVASLDSSGKVPTSQLPSYVDDAIEANSKSAFPATGESGKIYVAKDTNLTYRWSGSAYVEISPSLALGETSSTAYAGDKGAALASKLSGIENGAQVHKAPTTAEVKSALGTTGSSSSKYLCQSGDWLTPSSGVTSVCGLTKAAVTTDDIAGALENNGYELTDTTYNAATTSAAGLMSAADKSNLNALVESMTWG